MVKRKSAESDFQYPPGMSQASKDAYRAAMQKQRGYWPPKDPQPGICFEGDFVAVEAVEAPRRKGEKAKMQNRYTFQGEHGTVNIYGSTVMDSELQSLSLEVGDRVLILYKGVSENHKRGQNPAKLFSAVRVDHKPSKR